MMKLILFLAIVMFKCSRMSSAPADASTDTSDIKSGDYVANQPSYSAPPQPGMGYVSDIDDLGTTGVVFQFRRSIKSDNTEIEARRRSALDKGFMRFGRTNGNMMRFGRSPSEEDDSRIRKSDHNMMRFGRSNYMRFGRGYEDNSDDYNDASEVEDFLEPPALRSNGYEQHGNKILRLGRSSSESASVEDPDVSTDTETTENVESYEPSQHTKKSEDKNMMRFGRNNMMRFGRDPELSKIQTNDVDSPSAVRNDGCAMCVGKRGNMMRFGRSELNSVSDAEKRANMMRFGRSGLSDSEKRANMMRFGRGDSKFLSSPMSEDKRGNMMRFGRDPSRYASIPRAFPMSRQTRANSNDRNLMRLGRSGNLLRFGRNEKNLMRFGKRGGPQAISSSTKIYCEDENCVVQEHEDKLTDDQSHKDDQLKELFGGEAPPKSYGEYILEK